MAKNSTPKTKPAKTAKAAAPKTATACIALAVGHRSCPCPACSHNAPKK